MNSEKRALKSAYDADLLRENNEKSVKELRTLNQVMDRSLLFTRILADGSIIHIGEKFSRLFNVSHLQKNLKFSEITFYSLFKKNINILEQKNIKVNFLKINIFEKILIFLKTSPRFELIHQLMKIFVPINIFENKLHKENIDLVYFVSPSRLALELKI